MESLQELDLGIEVTGLLRIPTKSGFWPAGEMGSGSGSRKEVQVACVLVPIASVLLDRLHGAGLTGTMAVEPAAEGGMAALAGIADWRARMPFIQLRQHLAFIVQFDHDCARRGRSAPRSSRFAGKPRTRGGGSLAN